MTFNATKRQSFCSIASSSPFFNLVQMDNSENALNVGEVHEQRINTANYHTLTPISLKDLSIGEEDEKHISSK